MLQFNILFRTILRDFTQIPKITKDSSMTGDHFRERTQDRTDFEMCGKHPSDTTKCKIFAEKVSRYYT